MGKSSSIVTLFFTKKPLTKTDRCAGALSWRRSKQLVSHYSGAFTSAQFPKAKKDINLHFFIHSSNSWKLYQRIAVNYTSEPRNFEATTYKVRYCEHEKINCRDVSMMGRHIGSEGATRRRTEGILSIQDYVRQVT